MELTNNLGTSLYSVIVLILVLSLLLISFLTRKSSKLRKYKGLQLPPGPKTLPIIGNLAGIFMNRPIYKWIHRVMDEMQTEIACFRFGRIHVITITSSEIPQEALKEKDEIFADRRETYSAELASGGFKHVGLNHYGDQWKKMMKVMASTKMSPKTLNMLLGARNVEADNLLAYVHSLYVRSKTVNMRDIARTYAYVVTQRMLFGWRYFKEGTEDDDGGLGPMEKEHVDALFKMMNLLFSFRPLDYVPFLKGWDIDGQETEARDAAEIMIKYNDAIVDQRIDMWNQRGGKEIIEDWLDSLFTFERCPWEAIVDTSRNQRNFFCNNQPNNVEWTLAEMLNDPKTLEKAVDELDKVVGKDRLVEESDVPNLNFIKACSRESFRLHPVAPFVVPHATIEDTSFADYFIPKGSQVFMSRVGLGRNPKIWEEPNMFKAERHLGSSHKVSLHEPEMRFVSFSIGRRQAFDWSIPRGLGPGRIELVESETSMFMSEPLVAVANPRLAPHMYPKFRN